MKMFDRKDLALGGPTPHVQYTFSWTRAGARLVAAALMLGWPVGCAEPVEESTTSHGLVTVASAYYAGTTLTLGSGDNDAVWFVNQSDAVWSDRTQLNAIVTHGGALNASGTGLDHIAISVRGLSVEGAFQQMMKPLQTGTFLFGEAVSRAGLTTANLKALISGRGITFWGVGASQCSDSTRPCARFENYTFNFDGPGLIPNSVPLNVTTAPFQVVLISDDHDMSFKVLQNGVVRSSASCRALGNNSSLCGQQPDDAGTADAFVAFVNGPGIAGRTVGGTSISVTHQRDEQPTCPGCQPY
jgi:hypothetical protein